MTMWGIHNDAMGDELVEHGFVSIGWERIGNLRAIGDDRERLKAALAQAYPEAKPGAFPVWAGVLLRFAFEMTEGDIVISPDKASSTLNFGIVDGPYTFTGDTRHPHRRAVKWTKLGVPRGLFPQEALYEIGSAVTLFRVRRFETVFQAFLDSADDEQFLAKAPAVEAKAEAEPEAPGSTDDAASTASAPTASSIADNTHDFIVRTLLEKLTHEEFEHFTADLLRAMGYEARVTTYRSDGGIDVIAHMDPLGLQPPLIKVQCKHTTARKGRPEIQGLLGALSQQDEHGLFVTLGSYTPEAMSVERERPYLRLLGGKEIVDLVLRHYADLPARWRDLLPLRQVYVVLNRTAEQ